MLPAVLLELAGSVRVHRVRPNSFQSTWPGRSGKGRDKLMAHWVAGLHTRRSTQLFGR